MDVLIEAMAVAEKKTAVNAKAEVGDYVKDGLLHCGKCHTPKQYRGFS